MTTLRVVIADDEPVARDALRSLLADEDGVEIVGEAATGPEAVAAIDETAPDIVLLDIRMPEMDGFEVVDTLGTARSPAVVFVTAYDEFAVRAFEVHALDYVTKPFGRRRLHEAIERAREQIRLGRAVTLAGGLDMVRKRGHPDAGTEAPSDDDGGDRASDGEAADGDLTGAEAADGDARGRDTTGEGGIRRLTARRGDRRHVIAVADIDWVEGAGDYARLHVGEERFLIRRTLTSLARSLHPRRFARIHRSTVVNLARVKTYHPISHGDYAVLLRDGTRLRVSRTRRKAFLRRLRGGDA